ncbi:MAG: xylulokinase [Rhodothermales bacterium]|nr:xylulokinase [Rhodothermales bacterium]MBO6780006.1 xylulokinase [Rhodothermales bacterium]
MGFVLGLDVSTTACKALLLHESERVLAVSASPHPLHTPQPLWSEQDPEDWWAASCLAIRGVLDQSGVDPGDVKAVGLTGQMHGLVLLDERGDVLRPAMLWNDQRASAECAEIREAVGLERLVAITGNDAFAGFSAPKLLWVRRHEPEVLARVRRVLLPKDYLRFRLTGRIATDLAGAGGTLFLDLTARNWSAELLRLLDVPGDWLPPVHEGPEVTGVVKADASRESGLPAGIPVVAGAGDQAAQAVGVGAVDPQTFALTIGTSGVVFAPSATPRTDPTGSVHAFPHALPGMWHLMGVMLSAGGSLAWYRDTLAADVPFAQLLEEAAGIPAGCEGLSFLPYLSGERTPHANPDATGAFVGLTRRHRRGHLTRAVLEGVAFGLRDNLDLLAKVGLDRPSQLRASGGAMKSPLWSQILADVLETDLVRMTDLEGGALGAALLAGPAGGLWPDVKSGVEQSVSTDSTVSPDSPGDYAEPLARFRALYPALHA